MIATVGLTGGIGSGKTTIANLFALHFSIPIYIADTKAKELVANNKQLQQEIVALLGEEAFVEGCYNTSLCAAGLPPMEAIPAGTLCDQRSCYPL